VGRKLKLGEERESEKYELEELQGVNTSLAEKFAEIGVTTFLILAYEDPIQLTMRMNLPFRVIADLISQALFALYLSTLDTQTRGAHRRFTLEIYRRYLIRSVLDVAILYRHMRGLGPHTPDLQSDAQALFESLAADLRFAIRHRRDQPGLLA
jgi:hypothetical protein